MTKHCPICWLVVNPDGCGYYHKNANCLINQYDYPFWIDKSAIFNTEYADYGDRYEKNLS